MLGTLGADSHVGPCGGDIRTEYRDGVGRVPYVRTEPPSRSQRPSDLC